MIHTVQVNHLCIKLADAVNSPPPIKFRQRLNQPYILTSWNTCVQTCFMNSLYFICNTAPQYFYTFHLFHQYFCIWCKPYQKFTNSIVYAVFSFFSFFWTLALKSCTYKERKKIKRIRAMWFEKLEWAFN